MSRRIQSEAARDSDAWFMNMDIIEVNVSVFHLKTNKYVAYVNCLYECGRRDENYLGFQHVEARFALALASAGSIRAALRLRL